MKNMNINYLSRRNKFQNAFLFVLLLTTISCDRAGNHYKDTSVKSINEKIIKDTERIHNYIRAGLNTSIADNRITLFKKALTESIAINYSDGVVKAVFNITADFFVQGKFDSCYKYYALAFRYASNLNFQKDLLPKLFLNNGTFYYLQGDYVAADSFYYAGLQLTQDQQDLQNIKFLLLYNLHFTKNIIGQKKLALQYINEAEKLSRKEDDSINLLMVLKAKAEYYSRAKRFDDARKYLDESIIVNKGTLDLGQCAIAGHIAANSDNPEKAIPLLYKGIAMATKQNVDYSRIDLNMELGNAYNKIKMYTRAESILSRTLKETIEKGFKDYLNEGYTYLTETYEKEGKFKKALAAEKKLHSINDSLINIDKIKALNELEVKYKTAEKDRQLTLNNLEISQQQNRIAKQTTLIISISMVILLLLIILFVYTRLKRQQITSLQQQQEINNLKAKMEGEENERQRLARDLHDGIGGMLSTALMNTSILEDENPAIRQSQTFDAIKTTIRETAVDIRKTANNLMPDPIIKLGLAEAISQYAFSIRKPTSIDTHIQTYGELDDLDLSMRLGVYRIVQELLHNVIKHSMATEAIVQVVANKNMVGISVEDNGKGFDDKIENHGSGLKNLRQRVKDLGGKLSLQTAHGQGTVITIEIPVQ
jgi:signal transduction histidine kinase